MVSSVEVGQQMCQRARLSCLSASSSTAPLKTATDHNSMISLHQRAGLCSRTYTASICSMVLVQSQDCLPRSVCGEPLQEGPARVDYSEVRPVGGCAHGCSHHHNGHHAQHQHHHNQSHGHTGPHWNHHHEGTDAGHPQHGAHAGPDAMPNGAAASSSGAAPPLTLAHARNVPQICRCLIA